MTDQDILDTVVNHLMVQKAHSIGTSKASGRRVIKYRGDDNRKCAIGCLIRDEDYHESMEGKTIWDAAIYPAVLRFTGSWSPMTSVLLRRLQLVHDNFPVEEWVAELRATATGSHLTFLGALYN